MADVDLYTDAAAFADRYPGVWGPYWLDDLIGVVFVADESDRDLYAIRTTDGGQTRDTPVGTGALSSGIDGIAAWFEQETPGNSGSKVHFCINQGTDTNYIAYDIATGAWSSLLILQSSNGSTGDFTDKLFIQVTRNGNILCAYITAGSDGAFKSTNGGSSFSSIASPFDSGERDEVQAVACDTGDDADGALLRLDDSADTLDLLVYDDSGDSWTKTQIATSMQTEVQVYRRQFHASTLLNDGHVIVAAWTETNNTTADLKAWDIYVDSVSSPSITALTNVLTDSNQTFCTAVFIDQFSEAIAVSYAIGLGIGTFNVRTQVKRRWSYDRGSTWGSEEDTQADTADNENLISTGAMGYRGGRFQPMWLNDDLHDVFYNLDTEVAFSPQRVRPVSTSASGNWTAEPSGTLHENTADDDDATYDQLLLADSPSTLILELDTLDEPDSAGDGAIIVRAKRV